MLNRYSMSIIYGRAGYAPALDENGEWVKWADVENEIKKLQAKLDEPKQQATKYFCGQKIEIPGTNGIAHTYCGLYLNHEGPCK